jgi:hypothetical protein
MLQLTIRGDNHHNHHNWLVVVGGGIYRLQPYENMKPPTNREMFETRDLVLGGGWWFQTLSRAFGVENHPSVSTNYIAAYYLLRNLIQRYTIFPNNSQTLIYKWYIFP